MKYITILYGSQRDYDVMSGKAADSPDSPEDFPPMYEFMESYHKDLDRAGELVDVQGLAAPVHTRRIQLQNGVPVVTDGPYPETQEMLARYTVECANVKPRSPLGIGPASDVEDAATFEELRRYPGGIDIGRVNCRVAAREGACEGRAGVLICAGDAA